MAPPKATSATAMAANTPCSPPPNQREASHPPTAAIRSLVNPAMSGHTRRPAPCDAK